MFRKLLLPMSLLVAILAATTRWSVPPVTQNDFAFVRVSALLAIPWSVLLAAWVLRYGKDGLWAPPGTKSLRGR